MVEIDESHFFTVKQGQGRNRDKPQNWILAGIERDSNKFFAVALRLEGRRDMTTLEPLINYYIRPGSIIMSDSWKAYDDIEKLVDGDGMSMNYEHYSQPPCGFCRFRKPVDTHPNNRKDGGGV